ncbi:MAG TPA: hypothetical protein VMW76_10935 [Bacteroidales bacterium]|nr:hypothetical protein [Bacteroidales bacterium]
MEEYLNNMADLLEVDFVKESDYLDSFDAWDSLTILSVIAFADEEYGISLSAQDISESETIEGLYKSIQAKK